LGAVDRSGRFQLGGVSDRLLSEDERVTIADLRRQGLSMRAVAEKVCRSPSTISRELRRNQDPERG
jgi:transposase, IS30 family